MGRFWAAVAETVRRDFVAGLLAFVPVVSTIIGIVWIIERLDNLVLPKIFAFFGMAQDQPPFFGVVVTLAVILLAGALTRSFIGRTALRIWERLIDRVPVARSLYSVLKQFMQAVFGEGEYGSFQRVVLVEYPRRGTWCYAFVTGIVQGRMSGTPEQMLKIFIPSTPNPTTGYYLLVPQEDVRDTGLSVEEAFRLIISAGISAPVDGDLPARIERIGQIDPASAADPEKPAPMTVEPAPSLAGPGVRD